MLPDLSIDWILILPELLLATGGMVLLMVDLALGKGKDGWLGALSLVVLGTGLLALFPLLGRTEEFWGKMLIVDDYALFFKGLFVLIGVLVVLSSLDFVRAKGMPSGEFFSLLLFAVLGMMFMASSRDLITIYLGLELSSISSYVLAGLLREDPRSNEAAVKYFLVGALGSAVLLFGMSLLFGVTGDTHLTGMAGRLPGLSDDLLPVAWAGIIFLVAGFGIKIASAPFHMWVPDVYEGAPTPVTAFFSVGPKAAAFAALLRVFAVGLDQFSPEWTTVIAVLSVATMFVGNLTALLQTNIKRMLGYSSIAQAGYVMVGLAVATPRAFDAMAFYLLAYALMNMLAFAIVIMLNTRGIGEEIDDYDGLSTRAPVFSAALVWAFLSLIGIPPTAGFFGKLYLFAAAVEKGLVWLALVMVINSVVSVGYYYAFVRRMYLLPVRMGEEAIKAPPLLAFVTVASALAVLLVGIYPGPFLGWAGQAASMLH